MVMKNYLTQLKTVAPDIFEVANDWLDSVIESDGGKSLEFDDFVGEAILRRAVKAELLKRGFIVNTYWNPGEFCRAWVYTEEIRDTIDYLGNPSHEKVHLMSGRGEGLQEAEAIIAAYLNANGANR